MDSYSQIRLRHKILEQNLLNKRKKFTCTKCIFSCNGEESGSGSCWLCKDFSNFRPIQKEKIKMKQIVLELPEDNPVITYRWLVKNNACKNGLLWFVETFGKETTWEEYKKHFKHNLKAVDAKTLETVFDTSWKEWVEDRLDFNRELNDNYILYDPLFLTSSENIYVVKNRTIINLILKTSKSKYVIAPINRGTYSIIWDEDFKSISEAVEASLTIYKCPVYVFTSFKELSAWMNELGL